MKTTRKSPPNKLHTHPCTCITTSNWLHLFLSFSVGQNEGNQGKGKVSRLDVIERVAFITARLVPFVDLGIGLGNLS